MAAADFDRTWCDDVQAAADAAAIMRLGAAISPADQQWLDECAKAACDDISAYLDIEAAVNPPLPQPAALRTAHAQVTVRKYRRKDAPFGVVNAFSPETGSVAIGSDDLADVYPMLTPYKGRWSIG